MALEILQGEDAEESGGSGINPGDYQIPVRLPPAGGLGQAQPSAGLASAKQDYLKATQDMINALEQRIGNQGYDISRLLFAFGQPTSTGSLGSAFANIGAEASRQRTEQDKMMPSMMKMRTELAANRLGMAQQEEAERIAGMLGIGAPGANVQAAPGSGASAEAAAGAVDQRRMMSMNPEQLLALTRSLGPAGEKLYSQIMQAREDYRKSFLPGGEGSFYRPDTGERIFNPAELAKPIERQLNLGNFSGDIKMPLGDWMKYDKIMEAGGPAKAAEFIVGKIPGLGGRIGAIAPSRPVSQNEVSPVQAPPPAERPAESAVPAAARPFETAGEREQRQKLESKQGEENISMLTGEVKEARAPILGRYDKADSLMQEAKQMSQLASTYPYAIGIFNKPGAANAIAQLIKEGLRVGNTNVTIAGFEDSMRRLVRANPDMVQKVAKERNISTDQAQKYLQQQGLDAVSLLLQSERRLDSLLNKAERKGEGQVSNYERVLFTQVLPSLSNDPIKAYLFKTLALQEMAKFDKQVGQLLMKRSDAKDFDPRKMYDSDDYKRIRANYINSLEGSMREFFPETKGRLAEARKVAGV